MTKYPMTKEARNPKDENGASLLVLAMRPVLLSFVLRHWAFRHSLAGVPTILIFRLPTVD